MTILYQEFKAKYKEKTSDKKFSEDFAKELRKAMLDCPYLSKKTAPVSRRKSISSDVP